MFRNKQHLFTLPKSCLVCAVTSRGQCYTIVLQPRGQGSGPPHGRLRVINNRTQTNTVKLEMLVSKLKSVISVSFRSTLITHSALQGVDKHEGQSKDTCYCRYLTTFLALGPRSFGENRTATGVSPVTVGTFRRID